MFYEVSVCLLTHHASPHPGSISLRHCSSISDKDRSGAPVLTCQLGRNQGHLHNVQGLVGNSVPEGPMNTEDFTPLCHFAVLMVLEEKARVGALFLLLKDLQRPLKPCPSSSCSYLLVTGTYYYPCFTTLGLGDWKGEHLLPLHPSVLHWGPCPITELYL